MKQHPCQMNSTYVLIEAKEDERSRVCCAIAIGVGERMLYSRRTYAGFLCVRIDYGYVVRYHRGLPARDDERVFRGGGVFACQCAPYPYWTTGTGRQQSSPGRPKSN